MRRSWNGLRLAVVLSILTSWPALMLPGSAEAAPLSSKTFRLFNDFSTGDPLTSGKAGLVFTNAPGWMGGWFFLDFNAGNVEATFTETGNNKATLQIQGTAPGNLAPNLDPSTDPGAYLKPGPYKVAAQFELTSHGDGTWTAGDTSFPVASVINPEGVSLSLNLIGAETHQFAFQLVTLSSNEIRGVGWTYGQKGGADWYFVGKPKHDNQVPEPATMSLFGVGLLGAALRRRRV